MPATSQDTASVPVALSAAVDGVAVLTLDRPPANALDNHLVDHLTTVLDTLAGGGDAPALVLTGAGRRFFCAGGDITEALGYGAESMAERMASFHALLTSLENYPRPVVCAVNGWCVGGGIEMTLFADAVYASTEARFVFPEINHGMMPAAKGLGRARRVLGDRQARRLLLGGDPVDAREAETLGIVDRVVEPDDLLGAAMAYARAAAAKPAIVFASLKRALNHADGWSDQQQLDATVADARTIFDDEDARAAREAWNG